MFNCPKCVGILEEHEIEEVDCYVCNVCHGLWLEPGDMAKLLHIDKLCCNISELNLDEYNETDTKAHDNLIDKLALCPFCPQKTPLQATPYPHKKHVIHYPCPKGHGEWLDGGEIHKLRSSVVKKGLIIAVILMGLLFVSWIIQSYVQNLQELKQECLINQYHEKHPKQHAKRHASGRVLYHTLPFILDPDESESHKQTHN